MRAFFDLEEKFFDNQLAPTDFKSSGYEAFLAYLQKEMGDLASNIHQDDFSFKVKAYDAQGDEIKYDYTNHSLYMYVL